MEILFSSKSLTKQNMVRNDRSHQHLMDLMDLCQTITWKQLLFPRLHLKGLSNLYTLITEELKGKMSIEEEHSLPHK